MVFRYDDYSNRSSTKTEKALLAAFREAKFPLTIGVIPFICVVNPESTAKQKTVPLSASKISFLKEAIKDGLAEIALHGFSHQTIDDSTPSKYSEFKGQAFKWQQTRIVAAKEYLEKVLEMPVVTFIPPWNSYDSSTLKAVRQAGFLNFSSSIFGVYKVGAGLQFLPSTCSLRSLFKTVKLARRLPDKNPLIVVLFHQGDVSYRQRDDLPSGYEVLLETLQWLKLQKDVRVCSLVEAGRILPEMGPDHFGRNLKFVKQNLDLKRIYFSSDYLKNPEKRKPVVL